MSASHDGGWTTSGTRSRCGARRASQHYVAAAARGEMVVEYPQRGAALNNAALAQQQLQLAAEQLRDRQDRKVVGMDHWPFRTEEQVQQAEATSPAEAAPDKQPRRRRRAFLERRWRSRRPRPSRATSRP